MSPNTEISNQIQAKNRKNHSIAQNRSNRGIASPFVTCAGPPIGTAHSRSAIGWHLHATGWHGGTYTVCGRAQSVRPVSSSAMDPTGSLVASDSTA